MFDNIGPKLKGLAKVVCWLGIIGTIIYTIIIWISGARGAFWLGLLVLVIGILTSWIGSWACYGIGIAAEASEALYALESQMEELSERLSTLQNNIQSREISHEQISDQKRVASNANPIKSFNQQNDDSKSGTDLTWIADGDLYMKCPQCNKSMSISYLNSHKSCGHCGYAYKV